MNGRLACRQLLPVGTMSLIYGVPRNSTIVSMLTSFCGRFPATACIEITAEWHIAVISRMFAFGKEIINIWSCCPCLRLGSVSFSIKIGSYIRKRAFLCILSIPVSTEITIAPCSKLILQGICVSIIRVDGLSYQKGSGQGDMSKSKLKVSDMYAEMEKDIKMWTRVDAFLGIPCNMNYGWQILIAVCLTSIHCIDLQLSTSKEISLTRPCVSVWLQFWISMQDSWHHLILVKSL